MKEAPLEYRLYVLLGKLKREGKQKIEVRELMKILKINHCEPDVILYVVGKAIKLNYKVKIYGRDRNSKTKTPVR